MNAEADVFKGLNVFELNWGELDVLGCLEFF